MFGLLFKSYDDEFIELYEYLTQEWNMKPEYAKPFLSAYKKNLGKILSEGKQRFLMLKNSSDPGTRLLLIGSGTDEYSLALVSQAYQAYMSDLRRGKHIGTQVEMAIWAILSNQLELAKSIDRALGNFIAAKQEEKFPGLLEEVFQYEEFDIWKD